MDEKLYYSVDTPKVTQHPSSRSVLTGAEITFKIEATGDDLTFQWQKDGNDLYNDGSYSGTDTNTLNIQKVKKSDHGCYRCAVRNKVKRDGILSQEARLTVRKFFLILRKSTVEVFT